MRICLCCGMTEDGWGPGYQVLKHAGPLGVPSIERELLYTLRLGLFIGDEYKSRLIRRATTLADLINQDVGLLKG